MDTAAFKNQSAGRQAATLTALARTDPVAAARLAGTPATPYITSSTATSGPVGPPPTPVLDTITLAPPSWAKATSWQVQFYRGLGVFLGATPPDWTFLPSDQSNLSSRSLVSPPYPLLSNGGFVLSLEGDDNVYQDSRDRIDQVSIGNLVGAPVRLSHFESNGIPGSLIMFLRPDFDAGNQFWLAQAFLRTPHHEAWFYLRYCTNVARDRPYLSTVQTFCSHPAEEPGTEARETALTTLQGLMATVRIVSD